MNNSLNILKTVETNGGYTFLTVQVIGFQWGWRYGYGEFNYPRMLLNPIRIGYDSVIRPGSCDLDSQQDNFSAEAKFCRA